MQHKHWRLSPLTIAAFALFITLLFITPQSAHAARHNQQHCKHGPMPHRVCSAIIDEARHVPGAKISWARNPKLAFILRHESSFDPCAVNSIGHACNYTGTRSCGLFQRNPCMGSGFPNIHRETRDGLAYIVGRYRTVNAAYRFWRTHHWY